MALGLGNGRHGVRISNSNSNQIGAPATGGTIADGNTISQNGGDGVWVETGNSNPIRLNSIFANTGLGIDLGGNGVTDNDTRVGDSDPLAGFSGPAGNNLQNFPLTLTYDVNCGGQINTWGTLDSTPNTTFQVDLYSVDLLLLDQTGFGEGQTHIATIPVVTDGNGFAKFQHAALTGGAIVTATATHPNGDTSEFSTGFRLQLEYLPTGFLTTGDLFADNPDGTGGTPAFGGGCRFFPDAATYQSRTDSRNHVFVRATISPPVENVPVYFRSFDVDDPSANASIDPGDPAAAGSGRDNRGTVTGVSLVSPGPSHEANGMGYRGRLRPFQVGGSFGDENATVMVTTSVDGRAIVELATSFAPGDNFRVAASLSKNTLDALNETTDVPTTGFVKGFGGAIGDQIAVWRRFHVEQDKMATTPGDKATGHITGAPAGGAFRTPVDINIGVANEYEGGILRVGGNNHRILANGTGAGTSWVETATAPIGAYSGNPIDVTIYQDDWTADDATGTLTNSPPTVREDTQNDANVYDMLQPTTVRVNNRYADAYLQPELDALNTFDSTNVTSTQHVDDSSPTAFLGVFDPYRGTSPGGTPRPGNYETDVFWVVYVATGYEPLAPDDNDPGTEAAIMGTTGGYEVSVVFLETCRDRIADDSPVNVPTSAELKARVTAHEVGHQFIIADLPGEHRAGTLMDSDAAGPTNAAFLIDPLDIKFLRQRRHSPGTTPLQAEFSDHINDREHDLLSPAALMPIVAEAIQRWVAAGIHPDQIEMLRQVDFAIATDLPKSFLGEAHPTQILISGNAAGYGWFIDTTPHDDGDNHSNVSEASGNFDLLTVVMHELGHVLGLPDLDPALYPDNVMTESLGIGIRRVPTSIALDEGVLALLTNSPDSLISHDDSRKHGALLQSIMNIQHYDNYVDANRQYDVIGYHNRDYIDSNRWAAVLFRKQSDCELAIGANWATHQSVDIHREDGSGLLEEILVGGVGDDLQLGVRGRDLLLGGFT